MGVYIKQKSIKKITIGVVAMHMGVNMIAPKILNKIVYAKASDQTTQENQHYASSDERSSREQVFDHIYLNTSKTIKATSENGKRLVISGHGDLDKAIWEKESSNFKLFEEIVFIGEGSQEDEVIYFPANCQYMFKGFKGQISFENIDTSKVVDMMGMFYGCSKFNQPVNFDTSQVTNMYQMFYGCSKFNQEVNFNTSQVTNMSNMFASCGEFNQPVNFDTSQVKTMQSMFTSCWAFNQVVNFNTSKVEDMYAMFGDCTAFNQPVNFDTRNVTNMDSMFAYCESFNQPINFDTPKVEYISSMFEACSNMRSTVNLSDISQVKAYWYMFQDDYRFQPRFAKFQLADADENEVFTNTAHKFTEYRDENGELLKVKHQQNDYYDSTSDKEPIIINGKYYVYDTKRQDNSQINEEELTLVHYYKVQYRTEYQDEQQKTIAIKYADDHYFNSASDKRALTIGDGDDTKFYQYKSTQAADEESLLLIHQYKEQRKTEFLDKNTRRSIHQAVIADEFVTDILAIPGYVYQANANRYEHGSILTYLLERKYQPIIETVEKDIEITAEDIKQAISFTQDIKPQAVLEVATNQIPNATNEDTDIKTAQVPVTITYPDTFTEVVQVPVKLTPVKAIYDEKIEAYKDSIQAISGLTADELTEFINQLQAVSVQSFKESGSTVFDEVYQNALHQTAITTSIAKIADLSEDIKETYIPQITATTKEQAATLALLVEKAQTESFITNLGIVTPEIKAAYIAQLAPAADLSNVQQIKQAIQELQIKVQEALVTIDDLMNLSSDRQEAIKAELIAKQTTQEVIDLMANAQSENQQALEDAKAAAATTINNLMNLAQDEKDDFLSRNTQAISVAVVQEIIATATNKDTAIQTAKEELAKAKEDALNELNQLANLKEEAPEELTKAQEYITNAQNITQVQGLLAAAKLEEATIQTAKEELAKAKENALNELNQLANLKEEAPDQLEKAQEYITNAQSRIVVDQLLEAAQAEDRAIQTAKEALTIAKQTAQNDLEKLINLPKNQRDNAQTLITNAITIKEVQEVMEVATEKDAENEKFKKALDEEKAKARATLDTLKNLKENQRTRASEHIDLAQTIEVVNQVIKVSTEQDAANAEAKKALENAKESAQNELNQLENLKEQQPDELTKAQEIIKKANSIQEVNNLLDAAKNKEEALKKAKEELQLAKNNAKSTLTNLENLTPDEQAKAQKIIENANSILEVNELLEAATERDTEHAQAKEALKQTKLSETDIIDNLANLSKFRKVAIKEQLGQKQNLEEIEALMSAAKQENIRALETAKEKARTEIASLTNLKAEQQDKAVGYINDAENIKELETVINVATAKNTEIAQAKKALQDAKDAATATIDNLTSLNSAQKEKAVDYINKAETIQEVETISQTAKTQNDTIAKAKQQLQKAKEQATEQLKQLNKLTLEQQTNVEAQITKAITEVEVEEIIQVAIEKNNANIKAQEALDAAKQQAQNDLQQLTSLTDKQKKKAEGYIQSVTTIKAVRQVVDTATEQNNANIQQQIALENAKTTAQNELTQLKNLPDAEVTKVREFIKNALTIEEVTHIQSGAIAKDTAIRIAKEALDAAKTEAQEVVEALINLPQEEKDIVKNYIEQATTTQQVQTIKTTTIAKDTAIRIAKEKLDAAKTKVEEELTELKELDSTERTKAQEYIRTAKSNETLDRILKVAKTQNAAKLKAKQELEAAKENLKEELTTLENLTKDQIIEFQEAITNSATITEVTEKVNAAQAENERIAKEKQIAAALQEAKSTTLDLIEGMELTNKRKDALKVDLDKKETIQQVIELRTIVETENQQAIRQKAENNAKEAINALTNFPDKQMLIESLTGQTINEIKRIEAIANIKAQEAKIQHEQELIQTKTNAKTTIDSLIHLRPDQITQAKATINKALTINEVKQELERAKELAIHNSEQATDDNQPATTEEAAPATDDNQPATPESAEPATTQNSDQDEPSTSSYSNYGRYRNQWLKVKDIWYYYNNKGLKTVGWLKDGAHWYFFNQKGEMQIGWLNDEGHWYYLHDNGQMARGWEIIDGKYYQFRSWGGMMQNEWEPYQGDWYYFKSDGSMATNETINGWQVDKKGAWIK